MKNSLRSGLLLILVGFLAYNSLYFKKLDEVKAGTSVFNAKKYAQDFWKKDLPQAVSKSVEAGQLISELRSDKNKAFDAHSHALGIGNIRYFLLKGKAKVTGVSENEVEIQIDSPAEKPDMHIATEFVFGNAVRDAAGTVDINAFDNSMHFNNVSAEINEIIRGQLLPSFKSKVKKGDMIEFAGAIELNREHLKLQNIEIIPVSLKILEP